MEPAPESRVLYLYGVIQQGQRVPSDAGASLQAVFSSTLVALVEPVSQSEFSPEALDVKLRSADWVAHLAQRHEAVLERAMREGPIVPARLCTLFSSIHALKRSLAEDEGRFLSALERVKGREEWGLKVFCNEDKVRATAGMADLQVRAFEATLAGASPGQAFVLRKKRDARLAELAATRMDDVANEAVGALAAAAADLRLRTLLSGTATGRKDPMILNLAALIDRTSREVFHDVATQLLKRFFLEGFTFEVSGPWPPYSFCDDAEGAMAALSERTM